MSIFRLLCNSESPPPCAPFLTCNPPISPIPEHAQPGFVTRNILAVPVFESVEDKAKKIPVAVMQVMNKKHGEGFNRTDETMMNVFASHSAVVLERARLHAIREKGRECFKDIIRQMPKISTDLVTRDCVSIVEKVERQYKHVIPFTLECVFFFVSYDGQEMWCSSIAQDSKVLLRSQLRKFGVHKARFALASASQSLDSESKSEASLRLTSC